ncbi:hypothetical protein FS842_004213 [Serendipita sp. 407]|nr:hypothetical protein FS842_004213 [Serendipita sp. 407]
MTRNLDISRSGLTHPNLKRLPCQICCSNENVLEIARHLPNPEGIGLFHGLYGYYEEEDEDWENRSVLVSQRHSPMEFAHSAQDHLRCYLALPNLRCIHFPNVKHLMLGHYPPECGIGILGDIFCLKKLVSEAKAANNRLIEAVELDILAKSGSRLSKGVIGSYRGSFQDVYELGDNRKLKITRYVSHDGRGRRKVSNVRSEDARGFFIWTFILPKNVPR